MQALLEFKSKHRRQVGDFIVGEIQTLSETQTLCYVCEVTYNITSSPQIVRLIVLCVI